MEHRNKIINEKKKQLFLFMKVKQKIAHRMLLKKVKKKNSEHDGYKRRIEEKTDNGGGRKEAKKSVYPSVKAKNSKSEATRKKQPKR